MKKQILCFLPKITSLGGPGSFQKRFIEACDRSGLATVICDFSEKEIDAFLIIGAPRRSFFQLIAARLRGKPIVQRLNGMNWIHRVQPSGFKYALRSEMDNLSIAFFRRFICTGIIYQSDFSKNWWDRVFGKIDKPQIVVHNGVPVHDFPWRSSVSLDEKIEILLVEGNLSKGLDFGLKAAVDLGQRLALEFPQKIAIRIAGKTAPEVIAAIQERISDAPRNFSLEFLGVVDKSTLSAIEANAAMLISVELNTACPNSVIEALACGLPVIGFDTGSLRAIVGDGGVVVPYGANPWKLEAPLLDPLFAAAKSVIEENERYRMAARKRAEAHFDIADIIAQYVDFCFSLGES